MSIPPAATSTNTQKLTWGILGTGAIARTFAQQLPASRSGRLAAVASRDASKAADFAAKFAAPHAHGSYEALLADGSVQAVYIATPHPQHVQWAIAAARAGKHILCEKPIGLNQWEAMAIVEAAADNDVFLMEAFMYRCHPQTHKLIELITGGAIGEVRLIDAAFCFQTHFDPKSRLFDPNAGG